MDPTTRRSEKVFTVLILTATVKETLLTLQKCAIEKKIKKIKSGVRVENDEKRCIYDNFAFCTIISYCLLSHKIPMYLQLSTPQTYLTSETALHILPIENYVFVQCYTLICLYLKNNPFYAQKRISFIENLLLPKTNMT